MFFLGTQWADRIEAIVPEAPPSWDYSERTIEAVRDKLGEYLLLASERMTTDLPKYRERYLERAAMFVRLHNDLA